MRTVRIFFPPEQLESALLVHYLRNFGEDLFRELRVNGWGQIDLGEVDKAKSRFSVTHVHASKLRRLMKWLRESAERHNLTITLTVS